MVSAAPGARAARQHVAGRRQPSRGTVCRATPPRREADLKP